MQHLADHYKKDDEWLKIYAFLHSEPQAYASQEDTGRRFVEAVSRCYEALLIRLPDFLSLADEVEMRAVAGNLPTVSDAYSAPLDAQPVTCGLTKKEMRIFVRICQCQ